MELIEAMKYSSMKMKPRKIFVIYENQEKLQYMETHPIFNNEIGAGSPLTKNDLDELQDYFLKRSNKKTKEKKFLKLKGIIPENLIYCNHDNTGLYLMWYNKPQKRDIKYTDNLKDKAGTYLFNNILYLIHNDKFYIYEFDKFNGLKTNIKNLSISNVGKSGDVCLGGVKIKNKEYFEDLMIEYENAFWNSYFSHDFSEKSTKLGTIKDIFEKCTSLILI